MLRPSGAMTWLRYGSLVALLALVPTAAADIDGPWFEIPIPARAGHCAVYDPSQQRMVIFGGADVNTKTNDVWQLEIPLRKWIQIGTSGGPPTARTGHTGIYDPVRERMIVFGGNTGVRSNEVWALSLSGSMTWTPIVPSGTPPSPREAHTAIYDPIGDRMIVFGGMDDGGVLNDVWALSLAGTPSWSLLAPSGTPPSTRSGASAVYDSQRQRMIVFGGRPASGAGNDTWALVLSGTPSWSAIATTGTPPAPRMFHTALYDAPRDRMLILSGESHPGTFIVSESYQLILSGTPTWQTFTLTNQSRGSLVYDSVNDRGILYGGYEGVPPLTTNQAWNVPLTGGFPSRLAPSAPAPIGVVDPSAVYIPHRVVVFGGAFLGGFEQPGYSNQTSLLDLPYWFGPNPPPELKHDWIPFGTGSPPSARFGHSAIVDGPGDRMIVFGGENPQLLPPMKNDVWGLSLSTGAWSPITPSGTPPQGRVQHTAVFDPASRRMIVFGGQTTDVPTPPPWAMLNDVWQLDLNFSPPVWSPITPSGTPPSARSRHTAVLDLVLNRMIVFGGRDATNALLNDVWALSLTGTPAWTQLTPMGTPPSPREQHSAIYTATPTPRMIVYGGNSNREVWNLSLESPETWSLETIGGSAPDVWSGHAAVFIGSNNPPRWSISMLVFGGYSAGVRALQLPIATAVDLDPRPGDGRLDGAWPNPTAGEFQVEFTLPDRAPTTIGLFDLAGRRVASQDLGALGPGSYVVRFGDGVRLKAGLYWICLERGARRAAMKVAIVR